MAQRPLRRPFLGSIRSGILCAAIPLSKNSARKSRNNFTADHKDNIRLRTRLWRDRRIFWSAVLLRRYSATHETPAFVRGFGAPGRELTPITIQRAQRGI